MTNPGVPVAKTSKTRKKGRDPGHTRVWLQGDLLATKRGPGKSGSSPGQRNPTGQEHGIGGGVKNRFSQTPVLQPPRGGESTKNIFGIISARA